MAQIREDVEAFLETLWDQFGVHLDATGKEAVEPIVVEFVKLIEKHRKEASDQAYADCSSAFRG